MAWRPDNISGRIHMGNNVGLEVPVPCLRRAIGAVTVLSVLLGGCVIIPFPSIPEAKPFQDEEIGFVEVGKTTRQEVNAKLGQPQVSRADGSLVAYGEARAVASLLGAVYMGSGQIMPIETFHYVIVRYDADDVVTAFDIVRDRDGCTSDGICIEAAFKTVEARGWWYDVESALTDLSTIILAPTDNDGDAKRFPVEANRCGVYVYETRTGMPGHKALSISRPGRPSTPINSHTYLYWMQSPGPVSLDSVEFDVTFPNQEFPTVQPLDFECAAGNLYFVKVNNHNRWIFNDTITFSLDTTESGKKNVQSRRLIID